MPINISALGNRIRLRRRIRGLTQAELAQALRVSSQAISNWERGQNAPDVTLVPQLTKLLGVSMDWLLCTEPEEAEQQS